ncbi:hypothetical protein K1719_036841 [Acacia pycnantha]|nr:hypothetical protein K1719_036841 [Acacia pycnantha]
MAAKDKSSGDKPRAAKHSLLSLTHKYLPELVNLAIFSHIFSGKSRDNHESPPQEVNPFSNGAAAPGHDATVDIPLDNKNDTKKKEQELASWETDLKRKEKDIKRREEALS